MIKGQLDDLFSFIDAHENEIAEAFQHRADREEETKRIERLQWEAAKEKADAETKRQQQRMQAIRSNEEEHRHEEEERQKREFRVSCLGVSIQGLGIWIQGLRFWGLGSAGLRVKG